jgi:tRNA (guanosine-2'-O-)-methyltransferase
MDPGRVKVRVRYDELGDEVVERMVETLSPFVSAERRARIDETIKARTREVVLVLEDLYDEQNASAVLRTAEAFGVLEVHAIERTLPFEINTKIASGAYKWLDIVRHRDPLECYRGLKARGYRIWASGIRGDTVALEEIDVSPKIALVFGNEHQGLTEHAVGHADGRFRVPMVGFVESLNVSVAAGISTFHVLGRKRAQGIELSLPLREQARLRAEWFALSVRASRELLKRAGLPVPASRRQTTELVESG